MTLSESLRHPASLATAVVGAGMSIVKFPLLLELGHWLATSSGSLFTVASIFGFTIAPEVDAIPAELLKPVALALGAIYAASKLYRALKNLSETVDS
ncbi:hypothetical protein KTS45_12500 [Halomicroarcula limicola]|uniref:Uncharacterized protein n=1 Tax=Haloarcula limicola TaxID=1429915 RepID=A0A8J8C463_9EURY|nr:hypothetical protein [Halomicroarcula limicola]MBV0925017.1 hypothetical protein [Halomicroarcula limicola]